MNTGHLDIVDRRGEPRESLDAPAILTSLPDMELTMGARLTDLSHSGLGLNGAGPLQPGDWVAAEWGDSIALGSVAYCIEADGRYHMGIRTDYIILDRTGKHEALRSP